MNGVTTGFPRRVVEALDCCPCADEPASVFDDGLAVTVTVIMVPGAVTVTVTPPTWADAVELGALDVAAAVLASDLLLLEFAVLSPSTGTMNWFSISS